MSIRNFKKSQTISKKGYNNNRTANIRGYSNKTVHFRKSSNSRTAKFRGFHLMYKKMKRRTQNFSGQCRTDKI